MVSIPPQQSISC